MFEKKVRQPIPCSAVPNSLDIIVSYFARPDKYKMALITIKCEDLEQFGFSVNPSHIPYFAERLTYDYVYKVQLFKYLDTLFEFPYAYNVVFACTRDFQYVLGKNITVR